MNKQLLTALFVTAFSGMIFAAETPDYSGLLINELEYCTANNTELCQSIAAQLIIINQEKNNFPESGTPTEEQKELFDTLLENLKHAMTALGNEMQQHNATKSNILETPEKPSILDAADKIAEETGNEIADKLNITDSKE